MRHNSDLCYANCLYVHRYNKLGQITLFYSVSFVCNFLHSEGIRCETTLSSLRVFRSEDALMKNAVGGHR